ncbi:MAG: cob(I)yrinic acid a,c-diamide adenosyltransferase [Candidatus Heimdallarchaeaceae archaeon]
MLLHYYYGNREESTNIAIGTAIRAIGHGFNVSIIAINFSNESTLDYLSKTFKTLLIRKFNLTSTKPISIYKIIKDAIRLSRLDKHLLIVINFDLLCKAEPRIVEDLIQLLKMHNQSCELILTGELSIKEIENEADYLSKISTAKNLNINSKMSNSRCE